MKTTMKKYLVRGLMGFIWTLSSQYAAAEPPLHHVSSETCKLCHQEIYKQWKGSMHAQSSALNDPIHGTFYRNVVGDPTKEGVKTKKGTYPVCLQCHAPNAAKDKKTKLDSNVAYSEGVNCVVCHTLKKFNGTDGKDGKMMLGMKAYETAPTLQGPQGFKTVFAVEDDMFGGAMDEGDSKPNPHLGKSVELDGKTILSMPMEGNPMLMRTNDACMGCHDKRNNSKGVPLCRTGDEYDASKLQASCISCHMPVNNGIMSHTMGGGHDKTMLKSSIVFSIDAQKNGKTLKTVATLKNKQPHSLPTGAPFRNIYMKLTAFDATGKVLWQNYKKHPREEDPKAYFNYEITDAEGVHTSPPKASKLGPDNRLDAYETRKLEYNIPAANVAVIRGEVFYNLLWPELAKKFSKVLPKELTTAQPIALSEVKI
jgi:hypothetical protein